MVEVTKLNFEETMPLIQKGIKNATFFAIDTEFTGLSLGTSNNNRLFDTVEERYQRMRERVNNFIPCQIGLSIFTKESRNKNIYNVETYIFYIRPCMVGSIDKKFMFQTSAIDFLTKYDFDFNKFLKDGLPYVNENEEKQVFKELEEGVICHPHERMDMQGKREIDILINNVFSSSETAAHSRNEPKLTIPIDKITHVYFQVNEIRRKYPKLWVYEHDNEIVIEMVSLERRKELEESKSNEEERLLDYYLGFTKVFRLLKEAQKPIVGHNILMDLLLFYQNFHQNLPDSYTEFKKELHNVFPIIFDTRHMWTNLKLVHRFKQPPTRAGLFDIYEVLKNPPDEFSTLYSPDIEPRNCKKYVSEKFLHESGYDAFITGCVFLKICHLLAFKTVKRHCLNSLPFQTHLRAVAAFENRINLGYSRTRYIHLGGNDPPPQSNEFLYITPRSRRKFLNHVELTQVFSYYPMVEFKYVNQQRGAIIAVGHSKYHKDILKDFKDNPDFIVEQYSKFWHSPYINSAFWFTAVASSCLLAVLIKRYIID